MLNNINLRSSLLVAFVLPVACWGQESRSADDSTIGLHMGIRVGEVTSNSAVLWTRVCAQPRKNDAPDSPPKGEANVDLSELNGYLPGRSGRVVFTVGRLMEDGFETTPINVTAENDFVAKVTVTGLVPNDLHLVKAVVTTDSGETAHAEAGFVTAALPTERQAVEFAVITGQEYDDRDAGADGFLAYDSMLKEKLNFLVYTGDSVYYDRKMFYANSIDKMRHFWHRMYSLPKAVNFAASVPAYYEVDDHDILDNDSWPGKRSRVLAPMTMDDGLNVLREQTPIGDRPYRAVRWGKDLEVWLLEGRLYRSPNAEPDSAEKTIWGAAQKQWLANSLETSDATFKVIVSPTPIVGPDRSKGKNDNHANEGFQTEGRWIKELLTNGNVENAILCCGDRHWQYHSIEPDFGIHEFSCGPLSDQHAQGAPKSQPDWQVFRRVKGGYLTVGVGYPNETPTLTVQHHAVDGSVVNEWKATDDE